MMKKKNGLVGGKEHYNKLGIHDFDERYDEAVKLFEELEQDVITIAYEDDEDDLQSDNQTIK